MSPQDIKELRERLGLSMAAFGQLLGVGKSQVSRWESGSSHPTYKKNVKLNELANGQRKPQSA